jgi:polyhydroxyalkanoate synthesis regulator phasin
MPEELETVLRLVADGTLTPEQAAPIIEALTRAERIEPDDIPGRIGRRLERAQRRAERARSRFEERHIAAEDVAGETGRGRQLRIRVTEHGRQVVNLRIPIGFVDAALRFVPGIGGDQSDRIRDAVRAGAVGPIIDVEDPDGDGVLISLE